MPARRDKDIDPLKPVSLALTITGAELSDVLYGLVDIQDYLRGGNTSGEVKPRRGHHDGYEFKVTQL